MAGIFGVAGKEGCIRDLFLGTFYQQARKQRYCGLASLDDDLSKHEFCFDTHRGLVRQQFPKDELKWHKGNLGIGCVDGERQPCVETYKDNTLWLCFDGNITNREELRDSFFSKGESFSCNPSSVHDGTIVAKIISRERNFERGIERLIGMLQGDFAIAALSKEGVYAARGWGRKPLVIGRKEGSYAMASESNSFPNTGFEIFRDVLPGEVVLLDREGIHEIRKFDLTPQKICPFEYVYTAYPPSVIDGMPIVEVRINLGKSLARRFPVNADFVSPIPNSGRWHAFGYSHESKIPCVEVFVRFDYSDRSYTQDEESIVEEAKTKLIIVKAVVVGNRLIIIDDSIVRGNQLFSKAHELKGAGAKQVHARIACPPLMKACRYGKTTKKDEDCLARRISIEKRTDNLDIITEEIRRKLNLDSLGYATVEDLEKAIGMPREKLCLECWGF